MELVKVKIKDLKRADYNPRKTLGPEDIEYKKILKSIETFGYVEPIIVNKKDNTIISGHQRVTVLEDMGRKQIDCIYVDLNKSKEKALNIALNKITGQWDEDKLKTLLSELNNEFDDLMMAGFDQDEFDSMMNEIDLIEKDDLEQNPKGHLHQSGSSIVFNFHIHRFAYKEDVDIMERIKVMSKKIIDKEFDETIANEIILTKMLEALEEMENS